MALDGGVGAVPKKVGLRDSAILPETRTIQAGAADIRKTEGRRIGLNRSDKSINRSRLKSKLRVTESQIRKGQVKTFVETPR